jgi:hypothetical protein
MSSILGDYTMKAINAGKVLIKLMNFIKSEDSSLELTRDEVEAILMTITEQNQALKGILPKESD